MYLRIILIVTWTWICFKACDIKLVVTKRTKVGCLWIGDNSTKKACSKGFDEIINGVIQWSKACPCTWLHSAPASTGSLDTTTAAETCTPAWRATLSNKMRKQRSEPQKEQQWRTSPHGVMVTFTYWKGVENSVFTHANDWWSEYLNVIDTHSTRVKIHLV